jgi:alanine racemase
MSRPTRAIIDLDALLHNLSHLKQQQPGKLVIAVIKANAYGHGSVQCAKVLAPHADKLAVAFIEEALTLLDAGVRSPIVVLEGPQAFTDSVGSELADECAECIEWVIHDARQMEWLRRTRRKIRIWLKINIGMNRLGFAVGSLAVLLESIQSLPHLVLQGVITHYASADEPNAKLHQQQLAIVQELRQQFSGVVFSCANSAGIFGSEVGVGDWLRPGIALYGASPFADRSGASIGLRPVMRLVSEIIAVRTLEAGESVGYGGNWSALRKTRMGVIPIGYADGFLRSLSPGCHVMLNGCRVPLVGRISMDMIAVDVTDAGDVKVGDEVELWGGGISVDEQAAVARTIGYELLAGLGERIARVYLQGQ